MTQVWSTTWPTEPGLYWCYGWPFSPKQHGKPELTICRVTANQTSTFYAIHGQLAFKSEVLRVVFSPVVVPDLPQL